MHDIAQAFDVTEATVYSWISRFRDSWPAPVELRDKGPGIWRTRYWDAEEVRAWEKKHRKPWVRSG